MFLNGSHLRAWWSPRDRGGCLQLLRLLNSRPMSLSFCCFVPLIVIVVYQVDLMLSTLFPWLFCRCYVSFLFFNVFIVMSAFSFLLCTFVSFVGLFEVWGCLRSSILLMISLGLMCKDMVWFMHDILNSLFYVAMSPPCFPLCLWVFMVDLVFWRCYVAFLCVIGLMLFWRFYDEKWGWLYHHEKAWVINWTSSFLFWPVKFFWCMPP